MPSFAYTIKDEEEKVLEGTAEAESEDILRTRLSEQGFTVLEIKQTKVTTGARKVYGGVKAKDLSIMCRQFSVMIDAGVSLVRSLNVLSQQVANAVNKHMKQSVYRTAIPRNVRLSEAPSHGMPVLRYDKSSRGAEAYRELAREFVARNPKGGG